VAAATCVWAAPHCVAAPTPAPFTLPQWGASTPATGALSPRSGVTLTLTLLTLPWHMEVAGDKFPQVLADARLSAALATALADDMARLFSLPARDWVDIVMLSSTTAAARRASSALSADVVVQVPSAAAEGASTTMTNLASSNVGDAWLNETLAVYNLATAARAAGKNIADNAVSSVAAGASGMCSTTCIIIVCIIVVVVIGIVAGTVVVWVEQKRRRQRMKERLHELAHAAEAAEAQGHGMFSSDDDGLEDTLDLGDGCGGNPFEGAASPLAGQYAVVDDFGDVVMDGGDDGYDDDESYDAAEDALELDSLEIDSVGSAASSGGGAPSPVAPPRGSPSASRSLSPASPSIISGASPLRRHSSGATDSTIDSQEGTLRRVMSKGKKLFWQPQRRHSSGATDLAIDSLDDTDAA
jgi:hypothetical protein